MELTSAHLTEHSHRKWVRVYLHYESGLKRKKAHMFYDIFFYDRLIKTT